MCENAGPKMKILLHFAGLGAHQHRRSLRTRAVLRTARMGASGTPQQHNGQPPGVVPGSSKSTFGCGASGGMLHRPLQFRAHEPPFRRTKAASALNPNRRHQGEVDSLDPAFGTGHAFGQGQICGGFSGLVVVIIIFFILVVLAKQLKELASFGIFSIKISNFICFLFCARFF